MQQTVSRILSLAVAAGLVSGLTLGATTQAPNLDQQQAIVAELRGGILDSGTVAGAPFSAEARTIWMPDPRSGNQPLGAAARYYRDSAGRVRVEQQFARAATADTQRVFISPDPTSRTVYWQESATAAPHPFPRRIAAMTVGGAGMAIPVTAACVIGFFPARPLHMQAHGGAVPEEEALGERIVAGIRTIGSRVRTTLPAGTFASPVEIAVVEERWIAPDLHLLVYRRYEDSGVGVAELSLSNLSRAEPPASLFDVAEPLPTSGPIDIGLQFDNPYLPKGCRTGR